MLTFERVVVAPVRHDILLHVRVEGLLHAVHVFGVVLLAAFRLCEGPTLAGFLQFRHVKLLIK